VVILLTKLMIKTEQDKRDKKIIEAYLAGEIVRFLASINGLTTQEIYHILKRNKIKLRKRFDKRI